MVRYSATGTAELSVRDSHREFYRPSAPPEFSLNGKTEKASIGFYEVLEPKTAKAMALFTNTPKRSPAITVNDYGKGTCHLHRRSWADGAASLVRSCIRLLAIEEGPETPSGVYARVVEGRTLYVNTTGEEKAIQHSRPQARDHQRCLI